MTAPAAPAPRPVSAPGELPPPCAGDELEVLIRARYPLLYVVSWEEERVEEQLGRIAARRGKELVCWSLTLGLHRARQPLVAARRKGVADPLELLDGILESKQAAIYLLKDFHVFLGGPAASPGVIRRLREVAAALADSYKTVVIVSPLLQLPPELEKEVTVLDYPLPGPAELEGLLDGILAQLPAAVASSASPATAEREGLVAAALGLTLKEAENVFAKTLVLGGRLDASAARTILQEKRQIVRKCGVLEFVDADADLDRVGGLELLKAWLGKRAQAFSARARGFGLPAPRGVLLVGVQGCGKSLCAKAVSRSWNLPLLRFDLGRVFGSLVGSSEENVRRAIAVAESVAPAILWIDEIDKGFAGVQSSGASDGGTTARVLSTLLTWFNEKTRPVFVVATANDVTQLPPELLRKGRLDELFFVDLPTAEERAQVLAIQLARRGRVPDAFDLPQLARLAPGFSGAELEEAVISGLYDAFGQGVELTTAHLATALRETVPLSRTMSERLEALRSWADGRARPASRRGEASSGRTGGARDLELTR
ncbi:MAG: AAA family ATPase [Myxococcota bacterium]|jgi:AAA+ superfamily predicted ATPase|nr:AAA family ATPase [Myxococcota bacterium]